jgi:hypothetical protein
MSSNEFSDLFHLNRRKNQKLILTYFYFINFRLGIKQKL